MGAVIHPIAMSYEEKELIRSMNTTESKAYFGPTFFYKTDYEKRILAVISQVPSLRGVVLLDYARERESSLITLNEILEQYQPLPKEKCAHELTGQDVAVILCTSGTTGGTKGVLLSHDNIRYSEAAFNQELKLTENDIMFMPGTIKSCYRISPWSHCAHADRCQAGSAAEILLQRSHRFDESGKMYLFYGCNSIYL